MKSDIHFSFGLIATYRFVKDMRIWNFSEGKTIYIQRNFETGTKSHTDVGENE